MSLILKFGLGSLGVLIISGLGLLVWKGAEPAAISIGADGVVSSEYSGNFGDDFKYHLVSTKNISNASWWEWSFNSRWKVYARDAEEKVFSSIDGASSLKSKCEEAYRKSTLKDIHKDGDDKYAKAVWRYCSLEGIKPLTIKESQHKDEMYELLDSKKIGKANETKLISVFDARNRRFWAIKGNAFWVLEKEWAPKEKAGTIFGDFDAQKIRGGSDALLQMCWNDYKKDVSFTDEQKSALTFCSLNGKSSDQ